MIFMFLLIYLLFKQTNKQTPSPPKQKTNKNTPNRQFFDPSDIWIEAPLKCGFQQQLKFFFFLVPELKFFSFITRFLT